MNEKIDCSYINNVKTVFAEIENFLKYTTGVLFYKILIITTPPEKLTVTRRIQITVGYKQAS